MEGDAYLNGLLTEGDQTRLTVAAPVTIRPFQFYEFAHSTPLDDEGTLAQFNIGYLQTRPDHSVSFGRAETASFQLSHPLIRGYHENVYVTGSLDGVNSENALLGDTVSDERTRALRLGTAYTINHDLSDVLANLTVSHGIDAFGARTANRSLSDPSFSKVNGQTGYDRLIDPDWIVRLRATAQYSPNPLPARRYTGLWTGGEVFYRHRLETATIAAPLSSTGAGIRFAVLQKVLLQLEAAKALINVPEQSDGWHLIFTVRVSY